uniref:Transposase n=1 Tax=Heterorhabditis bacteriophora TaxID=37862 RepID=A0A1I7XAP6_HETBA
MGVNGERLVSVYIRTGFVWDSINVRLYDGCVVAVLLRTDAACLRSRIDLDVLCDFSITSSGACV